MARLGFAIYAVGLAVAVWLLGPDSVIAARLVCEVTARAAVGLAIAGLSIATFLPVALSLLVWRFQNVCAKRWIPHLIFLPCAVVIFGLGESMVFKAANVPDGDSVEGYATMVASALLLVSLIAHVVALITMVIAGFRKRLMPSEQLLDA